MILSRMTLAALLLPITASSNWSARETAVFAGGCFWGVEAVFEHVNGVTDVVSGYTGGSSKNPTYEQVSSGETGHAEAVRVTFDPAKVSFETLLDVFFAVAHDPTQLNRQGPDVGTQYRSAVFYASEAQRKTVHAVIDRLARVRAYHDNDKIVTEVRPLDRFYQAEGYHQDYLKKHPTQPYIVIHDLPKLAALKSKFPKLYVER
jgi:peptide-methionine (S)-S-oxide reductase